MNYGNIQMNKDIIQERVKLNKHYKDNEDLLEFVVNRVIERTLDVIDSIKDTEIINKFLDRTISKAYVDILKENNRFIGKRISKTQKINYKTLNLPIQEFEKNFRISDMKQIYLNLLHSDENDSTKFIELMNLRYKEHKSLQEISSLMNIPEETVSEMLFYMSDYVNKVISV